METGDYGRKRPLMNFLVAFLIVVLFMSVMAIKHDCAEGGAG